MEYLKFVTVLVLIITLLMSCNENEDEGIVINSHNCIFMQNDDTTDGLIDDTERMIMNECMENSLSSKSGIVSNLIGEWELTGHGEGWVPNISQPCGYIIISEDELTFEFKNEYTDTISTHLWEIEEVNLSVGQYFRLNVIPEFVEGLFINRFCENYMYGDGTPSDGNMYLYTKVE